MRVAAGEIEGGGQRDVRVYKENAHNDAEDTRRGRGNHGHGLQCRRKRQAS